MGLTGAQRPRVGAGLLTSKASAVCLVCSRLVPKDGVSPVFSKPYVEQRRLQVNTGRFLSSDVDISGSYVYHEKDEPLDQAKVWTLFHLQHGCGASPGPDDRCKYSVGDTAACKHTLELVESAPLVLGI